MTKRNRLPNIHPGEVLQEEFLDPMGISRYRLAKEIGVITAMDKSKVSRAVAVLKTKGYLNQCPDDHDNRATRLSLSLQGRKFYQNIAPKALAWEQQLMAALEPTEQQDLINILSKLDQRIGQLS